MMHRARPPIVALLLLLLAAPEALAGPAQGPVQGEGGPSLVEEGRAARPKRRKRRRLRKPVRRTRFQNVTPHQHLGPGLSR